MEHPERGTKRRCPSCGAPYYDLNRDPPVCPKCQTQFVAAARPPAKGVRAHAKPVVVVPDLDEAPAFEEDEVLEREDDEADEPLIDGESEGDEGEELRD